MEKNVSITMSLEQAKTMNALLFANVIGFAQECDLEEASKLSKIGLIVSKAIKQVQGENTDDEKEDDEE